jgi:hypothetical protein
MSRENRSPTEEPYAEAKQIIDELLVTLTTGILVSGPNKGIGQEKYEKLE